MPVKLIDIHHAKDVKDLQETFDSGVEGLIHKASEGNWFTDPSMMLRMPIAWAIGFVLGTYHFYRSNVPGAVQASYFLKAIEPLRKLTNDRLIPVWCDLETIDGVGDEVRMREVLQFLRIVSKEYKTCGLYSSPGFWSSHTTKPTWVKLYWQWLAQWTPADTFNLPAGWSIERCRLWQKGIAGVHSWMQGSVPGIRGAVDIDIFPGTISELKAWAGYWDVGVPPEPPTPSPPPPVPPNHIQMLDWMLKADVDLNKAIELARKAIINAS